MSEAPELSDDDLETLGLMVDRLDNFAAGAALPVSDSIHKGALLSVVRDTAEMLRTFLLSKGFNPWS